MTRIVKIQSGYWKIELSYNDVDNVEILTSVYIANIIPDHGSQFTIYGYEHTNDFIELIKILHGYIGNTPDKKYTRYPKRVSSR